jgi:MFS family permease
VKASRFCRPATSPAGEERSRNPWVFVLVAAAILMVTMGTRQSLGLFLSALNTHTGLGIAPISFAMAVGQFVWGAVQPVFGVVADRWGPAASSCSARCYSPRATRSRRWSTAK